MSTNEHSPVNNVANFGKEVGRDAAKQALVWTIAGYGTQILRAVVNGFTKPKTKQPESTKDW